MTKNKYYRLFVFAVVMPINGILLTKNLWLGVFLIVAQIPTAYFWMQDADKY